MKTQSSLRTIFVDPEVLKVVLKGKPEGTQRLFGDKSYRVMMENWWTLSDSNRGPTVYETAALTNWAKGPYFETR